MALHSHYDYEGLHLMMFVTHYYNCSPLGSELWCIINPTRN